MRKHHLREHIEACIWPNNGPRCNPKPPPEREPPRRADRGRERVAPREMFGEETARQKIRALLADDVPMTAREIRLATGIPTSTVHSRLTAMRDEFGEAEPVDLLEYPWRWRLVRRAEAQEAAE